MATENIQVLSAAVIRVLRPFVLILLRHGVSYGTFAELTKWVYVDVALKQFGIPDRKQSTSRVSIITGLSRKEVTRVRRLPRPTDRESAERYNRAARVITAWRQEEDFLDTNGDRAYYPLREARRHSANLYGGLAAMFRSGPCWMNSSG
jgi:hypothetical protein